MSKEKILQAAFAKIDKTFGPGGSHSTEAVRERVKKARDKDPKFQEWKKSREQKQVSEELIKNIINRNFDDANKIFEEKLSVLKEKVLNKKKKKFSDDDLPWFGGEDKVKSTPWKNPASKAKQLARSMMKKYAKKAIKENCGSEHEKKEVKLIDKLAKLHKKKVNEDVPIWQLVRSYLDNAAKAKQMAREQMKKFSKKKLDEGKKSSFKNADGSINWDKYFKGDPIKLINHKTKKGDLTTRPSGKTKLKEGMNPSPELQKKKEEVKLIDKLAKLHNKKVKVNEDVPLWHLVKSCLDNAKTRQQTAKEKAPKDPVSTEKKYTEPEFSQKHAEWVKPLSEENLQELKRETLDSYKEKAKTQISKIKAKKKKRSPEERKTIDKRITGGLQANDRTETSVPHKAKQVSGPVFYSHGKQKAYGLKEEDLQEVSKKTLMSYVSKSREDINKRGKAYDRKRGPFDAQGFYADKKIQKRADGINRAVSKLHPPERLEELSNKTLASYYKKADPDKKKERADVTSIGPVSAKLYRQAGNHRKWKPIAAKKVMDRLSEGSIKDLQIKADEGSLTSDEKKKYDALKKKKPLEYSAQGNRDYLEKRLLKTFKRKKLRDS